MLVRLRCAVLCSIKPKGTRIVVYHQRLAHTFFFLLVMPLASCSLMPEEASSTSADIGGADQSAVESDTGVCQCPGESQPDPFTIALQALAQGDYEAASTAFDEHAMTAGEQTAREAEAGRTLTATLSQYRAEGEDPEVTVLSDRAMLIELVLTLIAGLEQQVSDLNAQNAMLSADLEKREEALKRLRELTLGQPEA